MNTEKTIMTPLSLRIIVESHKEEERTPTGLLVPDSAKTKPLRGTVIAVGPGKVDDPMTVQVGDTILYGKYAGTDIEVDGKTYLIMNQGDVFAIVGKGVDNEEDLTAFVCYQRQEPDSLNKHTLGLMIAPETIDRFIEQLQNGSKAIGIRQREWPTQLNVPLNVPLLQMETVVKKTSYIVQLIGLVLDSSMVNPVKNNLLYERVILIDSSKKTYEEKNFKA